MMDTITAIHTRYSCRAFSERVPSLEDLQTIAKAGAAAPSAMNRQPWRIIVVQNKALVDEMETEAMKILKSQEDKSAYNRVLSRGGKVFYDAPCMIVIPVAKAEKPRYESLDCGIVTQNIALAAASLGVNSVICGMAGIPLSGDKREEFISRLGFPEGYEFSIAVLLGYAKNPDGKPHEPDLSKISFVD